MVPPKETKRGLRVQADFVLVQQPWGSRSESLGGDILVTTVLPYRVYFPFFGTAKYQPRESATEVPNLAIFRCIFEQQVNPCVASVDRHDGKGERGQLLISFLADEASE